MRRIVIVLAASLLVCLTVRPGLATPPTGSAATPQLMPLGHEAYEIWRGIDSPALSRDGAWLLYSLTLQHGDPELVVRSVEGLVEHRVARGTRARFSADGSYVVTLVRPAMEDTRRARLDELPDAERPKAALAILDLSSGSVDQVERVRSFEMGADGGDRVAYLLEEPLPQEETAAGDESGETASETQADGDDKKMPVGHALVVRELTTGAESRFEGVTSYRFSDDGSLLAFATTLPEPGVWLLEQGTSEATAAIEGRGHYERLTFDDDGGRLAFLSDRDDFAAEAPEHSLYLWDRTAGGRAIADSQTPGLPSGWSVSANGALDFSDGGTRLYFGTAPRQIAEADEPELLEEERVKVDVWHWQDPLLQPMQLLQVDDERERSYAAVADLQSGALVQLADELVPDVQILGSGDEALAHGSSGMPYRKEISWESPGFTDHYRVDIGTGSRTLLRERHQGPARMSPDGGWLIWWDGSELAWFGQATGNGAATNLTSALQVPVHNEDHDWAYDPQPYGLAGWTRAAEGSPGSGVQALIYDRYDIWAVDPSGVAAPRNLTSGAGRQARTRLRRVELDDDSPWVEESEILLDAFAEADKSGGFWLVGRNGSVAPTVLVQSGHRYGRPRKAADADVMVYTRENVVDFPDLWVSGPDFADARRMSEANPQQSQYRWATAELTSWRSTDGELLEGLVHKPADFDPTRKYPLMVTFYERNSQNLHQHHPPTPHRSVIRQTFYASRDYVVFTPDITYEVGYPGESSLEDVVSGVLHMIDQGYIDERNIGAQGHSWGGYQIAYMVTKTDIFKAAAGGAPVSNMISAYGGIRWSSGMSRMFQYERTQSRLGGTLWEMPLRYLENSPIFWADKVDTPLMMMHNDHDGAVPWYQGIEMFVALRRLGKPAWLINYNDEPHWPTTHANKVDWNIRMQQFFDHYLKGEPAPRWLAEGIPALDKGKTLGLELIDTPAEERHDDAPDRR